MKEDLKCNGCGGQLAKIENEENTYVCLHCGNKMVIAEDVNNNNYNVTNHVTNHIYGNVVSEADDRDKVDLMANVEAMIKMEEYQKAYKMLLSVSEKEPGNTIVWWLLSKTAMSAAIRQFRRGETSNHTYTRDYKRHYEKYCLLAGDKKDPNIEKEYKELEETLLKYLNREIKYSSTALKIMLGIIVVAVVAAIGISLIF